MHNHLKTSGRGAFSLMELMIVIIILGLLASLVLPNLKVKRPNANSSVSR